MRLVPVALSVLVLPVALVAPVATTPTPAPEPVPVQLHVLPLPVAPAGGARSVGAEVTLPAQDTAPFSTVGVTWRRAAKAADVEVQVRTRGLDGTWRDWQDLEGQTEDTPDGTGPDTAERDGTAPFYAGPSDGVEVRVDLLSGAAPAGLRVDLIDPGNSPADAAVSRDLPRDTAEASSGQPSIVTRAEWGADESIKTCNAGYTGPPKVAFVHHTATTNDYTPAQAPAAIRGIYAYHVKSNGWCDIGYNFLVDRFGTLYEGRAGGIDKAVMGAHTGGFNTNSFGTSMLGTFTSVSPPEELLASLRRLIAWKLGNAYDDPTSTAALTAASGSKFASGTTHTFDVISGHRDAGNTTCPGDLGYAELGRLRTDVRDVMGAGLVKPTASPTSTRIGGTPIAVTSGLLTPTTWQLTVTSVATGLAVRTLGGGSDDAVNASWDLTDDSGVPVPAGTYRVSLTGASGTDAVVPWSVPVTVTDPYAAPSPSASPSPTAVESPLPAEPSPSVTPSVLPTPSPSPSLTPSPAPSRSVGPGPAPASASGGARFVPVTPTRVLDTRNGTGGRTTALGAGEVLDLHLAGSAGVPAGATAVALNLTGTHPSSGTHLTVWPTGATRPETAVLNLRPGATAASLVVAGLSTAGSTSVRNLAGTVDLVGDVVGYWTRDAGAAYTPVTPARVLDTRTSSGGGALADQESRRVQLTGRGGVPSGATAVVLNVTAVSPPRAGYLTVSPASGVRPGTSSVNFTAGQTVPNRVVTGLSPDGAVDVFAAGGAHVLVDVVGWFGPGGRSSYTSLTPARLVDSRDGTGTPASKLGPGITRDVQVTGHLGVPAGATAVVLSLTATGPTAPSTFITAFPDGTSRAQTSDLNLLTGETRSNLAVVPLSSAGKLSLYNAAGSTHVIADVLGYYSG